MSHDTEAANGSLCCWWRMLMKHLPAPNAKKKFRSGCLFNRSITLFAMSSFLLKISKSWKRMDYSPNLLLEWMRVVKGSRNFWVCGRIPMKTLPKVALQSKIIVILRENFMLKFSQECNTLRSTTTWLVLSWVGLSSKCWLQKASFHPQRRHSRY